MLSSLIAGFLLGGSAGAEEVGRSQRRSAYRLWDDGVSFVLKGDDERARRAWSECSALDPENPDCRAGLMLLQRPRAATAGVSAAVEQWNAGIERFQAGDYPGALLRWKQCLKADSSSKDCREGINRIEGRTELAAAPADHPLPAEGALTSAAEAVRHWNAGLVHFQNGDLESAREEWTACRDQDPANMDCHTGLLRIIGRYGGGGAP